ncbi:MAG: hypothetical protein N4A54_07755 [Peptostreptococcaceae bacterium]|jgi:hypothetical protein|nr:hypothetical protein [Peptostreptococcaceae bacterium]
MVEGDECNISLEYIGFSKRTYNCLNNSEILTVQKLLDTNLEEFKSIKNFGSASLGEIKEMFSDLNEESFIGKFDFLNSSLSKKKDILLNKFLSQEKKIEFILFKDESFLKNNLSIKKVDLSVKAQKLLYDLNIKTFLDLLKLNKFIYEKIQGMNGEVYNEIFYKLKNILYVKYTNEEHNNLINPNKIFKIIKTKFLDSNIQIDDTILKRSIKKVFINNFKNSIFIINNKNNIFENDYILSEIYLERDVYEVIKHHILEYLRFHNISFDFANLKFKFCKHLKCTEVLIKILDELLKENLLEKYNNKYRIVLPYIEDYLDSSEERNFKILKSRFSGKTLEEVGQDFLITRERVRQIEKKFLKNKKKFRDDDFAQIFKKYNWDGKLFESAYNVNSITYGYLNSKYKKGTTDLEKILSDDSVNVDVKQKVEKILFKDYLIIGNLKIKKDKNKILEYLLINYCDDEVCVDDIKYLFDSFLEDNELEKNLFKFPDRYFETTLPNSKIILWKYKKRLRYYKLDDIKSTEIVKALNLDKIEDIEYSTFKFFRDYPEVMNDWDIRDEYELHNLIKKVVDLEQYNIKMSRMPNLKFGKSDRNMQVFEMLIENAPIKNIELAKKYEEEYGVKTEIVLANYFDVIREYLHEGYFKIDYIDLPDDHFKILKEKLTDSIYNIKEIKRIYKREFPNGNLNFITPYNLKKMNFKMSNNLIYSNKFNSLDQQFRFIICKDDIFEADKLNKWILNNQSYYIALNSLKKEYQIIEFSHNKYLNIRRLEENGIFREDLDDYVECVYDFIGENFFTLKHIRKNGFNHELEELGFDDCFYNDLLMRDNRFKFRKLGNKVLFKVASETIKLADLVEHLILDYKKIDIYDLIDNLIEEYSINIEKYKLINIVNEKEFYYSEIMEKIYIDYDLYFEEV